MCLPTTFWRTEANSRHMTSQFGCLELLITRTFLSGPVKFEITRVDCIVKWNGYNSKRCNSDMLAFMVNVLKFRNDNDNNNNNNGLYLHI